MVSIQIDRSECSQSSGTLVALLSEQRDLCRQLNGFAERQRSLITGDEPELLLSVLGERQRVLDRLAEVSGRLRPYQQNWREVRGALSEPEGRLVDQILAEVNELLSGILKTDETDAQLLSARKQATAQSMTELNQGRTAGAAYAAATAAGSAQVDWTDE